jgi:hypothetical protein
LLISNVSKSRVIFVFCMLSTFVWINPADKFPYSRCLQTLKLDLNLIEALYYSTEFWGQVNTYNRTRGNTILAFDILNKMISSMTKLY